MGSMISYIFYCNNNGTIGLRCTFNQTRGIVMNNIYIYIYLLRIPLRRCVLDTTLCDKVCQWLAAGRWVSPGCLHQYNWPPQYSWTIVKSGVKHHNPKLIPAFRKNYARISLSHGIFMYMLLPCSCVMWFRAFDEVTIWLLGAGGERRLFFKQFMLPSFGQLSIRWIPSSCRMSLIISGVTCGVGSAYPSGVHVFVVVPSFKLHTSAHFM